MRRYDQRIYVLRVWVERAEGAARARWRASLSDATDRRRIHYFSSLPRLLAYLRELLDPWPKGPG